MKDIRDLLTTEKDVAVFPDSETSRQLRRAREFWDKTGTGFALDDPDLASLSDAEISDLLATHGMTDTKMPAHIRDLVETSRKRWHWTSGLALAACLAGGIAVGVSIIPESSDNSSSTATDRVAASDPQSADVSSLDTYIFSRPEPAPNLAVPDYSGTDLSTVQLPGRSEQLELNRAEMRELQVLLNRFDYGPVAQLGLPSEETGTAVARLREDYGLAEGGADRIVLDILRKLARQEAMRSLREQFKDGP